MHSEVVYLTTRADSVVFASHAAFYNLPMDFYARECAGLGWILLVHREQGLELATSKYTKFLFLFHSTILLSESLILTLVLVHP
jgi:hypothetical protein